MKGLELSWKQNCLEKILMEAEFISVIMYTQIPCWILEGILNGILGGYF